MRLTTEACTNTDMQDSISFHEAFFSSYAQAFCQKTEDTAMLQLKIEHTKRVVQHMRVLVQHEAVLLPHAHACILAALYHDIGRFEQFLAYKTFKDAQSVNHATLGVKVLKEQGILDCESKELRAQVLAAVGLHNRFAVPKNVNPALAHITHAVRDADKLDILRIMAEQFMPKDSTQSISNTVTFYAKDEPLLWSDVVVQDVLQNRLASYSDIVYINDFKLVLGSWVHDITYSTTHRAMHRSGYLQAILESLPKAPAVDAAKAHIFSLLQARDCL